ERDPRAARARAVDDDALVRELSASRGAPHDETGEGYRTGSLNIVVERRHAVAVALEDCERRVLREVFPLQDGARPARVDRVDDAVHECEVLVSLEALLSNAEVWRTRHEIGPIRPNVEADGERPVGAHAGRDGIERKLSDRDCDAAITLIADAED